MALQIYRSPRNLCELLPDGPYFSYLFPDEDNRLGCLLTCSEVVVSVVTDPDPLAPLLARNAD